MKYYWLLTFNSNGKTVLLGPYESEYRAQAVSDKLDYSCRMISLPTRDLTRATRIVKERRISVDGDSLDEASERVSHRI